MAALFDIFRGDDLTLRVTFKDKAGAVIDTTGWLVEMTARKEDVSAVVAMAKSSANASEILVVDAVNGVWDVFIVPADTANIGGTGRYVFDVQGTSAGGKIYTGLKDDFKILQDVTRP